MKKNRKLFPFLLLISLTVTLVLGSLSVTRHAFDDITKVVLQQRTQHKLLALDRMSSAYFRSNNFTEQGFASFLHGSRTSSNEIQGLVKFNPTEGFTYISVLGPHSSLATDTTIALDQFETLAPLVTELKNYHQVSESTPLLVKDYTGKEYLAVWLIIPAPTPSDARYVYYTLSPTADLLSDVVYLKGEYETLFSFGVLIAGVMLVLLPLTVNRIINE